jgi:exosortase D (VPLPA-CTERM-specific)
MVAGWLGMEEYSHGILIPFMTLFLIYQKKNTLALLPVEGSWLGALLVLLGAGLYLAGELASLFIIGQYAFLILLYGLILSLTGSRMFKEIWVPLLLLFFAVRLPEFLYQGLSSQLQLWSSKLGVYFIRACDITVNLEGNVIDLGPMQLQVVEACSGLRYLFPLMSLAFLCACVYRAAFWKRALVFLSSIPITLAMNSLRIGVIAITVEYFGKRAAEGFLHDFEGWIVFMGCTLILVAEMALLARLGGERRPFAEVFDLSLPAPAPPGGVWREAATPAAFWAAGGALALALAVSLSLDERAEVVPARVAFAEFPLQVGAWSGRRETMDDPYIETLKFDDYLLADFVADARRAPINLYAAYYVNQRKGESIHSPRSCIPGGGWRIVSHDLLEVGGAGLRLNRLLIQKGEERQLVYYWFKQRGRDLNNEYLVRWYLFQDALVRNRSDGALVRLTTPAPVGEDLAEADQRLQDFLQGVLPQLDRYIPD